MDTIKLEKIKEYWNTLPMFEHEKDVPSLPKVDTETWTSFFVPRLIQLGAIAKSELIDGSYYYGNYRNSDIGKWDGTKNEFIINRWKFGWRVDTCNHFEDDNGFALFVPIRMSTEVEINEDLLRR